MLRQLQQRFPCRMVPRELLANGAVRRSERNSAAMGQLTMFGYVRFRWQLRRLEREQDQLEENSKRDLDAAKKRNASDEDIEELQRYDQDTQIHFQEEIQKLYSEYLLREAYRLIIPYPDLKESLMWESDDADRVYLSQRGINKLRGAIRQEKKARGELFLMWMPGIVGILGALIGLASILMGKR